MIKKIYFIVLLCLSCPIFASSACPQAKPVYSPEFCASFKIAAQCHCSERKLPLPLCTDINALYNYLKSLGIEMACHLQKDTSTKECIDNWKCYFTGKDSEQKDCQKCN